MRAFVIIVSIITAPIAILIFDDIFNDETPRQRLASFIIFIISATFTIWGGYLIWF